MKQNLTQLQGHVYKLTAEVEYFNTLLSIDRTRREESDWMNLKILSQPQKSDTKECNLYSSLYMKFWRSKSVMTGNTRVATWEQHWGRKDGLDWKGYRGPFCYDGNVLYLDYSMGHINQNVHVKCVHTYTQISFCLNH